MNLGMANQYFNTCTLDGWNGVAWVSDVAMGTLQSFDRFITDRAFGQKKRIFVIGGDGRIPDQYKVVRMANGKAYIVVSCNHDISNDIVHGSHYLLQEAPYQVILSSYTVSKSASGMASSKQVATSIATFCDIDRIGNEKSTQLDNIKYTTYNATLPGGTVVTIDSDLTINGVSYDVKEVSNLLSVVEARVVKI